MMVKPDQLQLVNMISRKGNSGEVWRGSLWGKAVAIKLLPLVGVDERQLDCLRREVAVLLHTTGECKQVRWGMLGMVCWCCWQMPLASSACHSTTK
jgi:ABC-type antimicrobial peptide transport system ATPase subunit